MHWVQALIASPEILSGPTQRFPSVVVCPLTKGLALIPLTESLVNEIRASEFPLRDPTEKVAEEIEPGVPSLAAALSAEGPVLYVATYFHGGAGGQDALIWEGGLLTLRLNDDEDNMSEWPNSPISRALRHIGVEAGPGKDEFDEVGLGRHRSNEAWVRAHGDA